MSRAILLETQTFPSSLLQLIADLNIAEEFKSALLSATPRSILISLKPARLIISLYAQRLVDRAGLEALSQAVQQQYTLPQPPQLVWDIYYAPGLVQPQEYLVQHWKDLRVIFSQKLPLAETYLAVARFSNGEDNRLRIALPNEMSVAALRKIKAEQYFSHLLSERLQTEVIVRFVVGDFNEELQQKEVLYQRQLREEWERRQEKPPEKTAATAPTLSSRTILGRTIAAPAVPIAKIQEEEKNLVCAGQLVNYESKILRTGRQLILMDVFDQTDTIHARLFLEAGKTLPPEVTLGAYVKLRGDVHYDKYSQELCFLVKDLILEERPKRQDVCPEKRIELHAHTQMSSMDALPSATQLIARAAAFGHAAIAITDHGVVQAYPEAMAAGAHYGIKVIYGMEGYLIEDDWTTEKSQRPYHVTILIRNQTGVKHLYRLVSHAHLDYFYRHPRLPRSLLNRLREGLLLGTACEQGELFRSLVTGCSEAELESIAKKYDYLEIMPRGNNQFLLREKELKQEEELLEIYRKIYALGKRLGIPVVATGDVHFLDAHDEIFRCILQSGMGYSDAAQQAPLFYKTTSEMLEEFAYLGEVAAREVVIENPHRILQQIEAIHPLKQNFYPPRLPNADEELETLAFGAAREKYGIPLPALVAKRLSREISAIHDHDFSSLFLIARRLVQKSLQDGYVVGSRGSVGSSLAATMLGITEVNPLPGHYLCPQCHAFILDEKKRIGPDLPDRVCPQCQIPMQKEGFDIPFEVFMGFKGDKLPDIDLNFSGEYQSSAHKYLEEIFDREHIFRAGTISTVANRMAFGFVKKYLEENNLQLREAEVNRLTHGCAGVKRTTGQHPGGIMIVPADMEIYDFTPVQRPADDRDSDIITTHLDYHAIHDSLLKLDILGHDDPTSLRRLSDLTGVDVHCIPLDDPDTLKIFAGLESIKVAEEQIGTPMGTLGIPEFGTEFVRQMLEVTRPAVFSELVRISGLSHGTDVWLNNAVDLIQSQTATLATVISVRDDIMNYLIEKNMDPAEAFKIMEAVRKGKGVSAEQGKAMRALEVPNWYIDSCQKIKYIFPKAHAVAYCLMAFRIAYFKVHYPAAFYTNYFSLNAEFFDAELIVSGGLPRVQEHIIKLKSRSDLTTKEKNSLVVLEVVREAFARHICFQPVSLMDSHATQFQLIGPAELLPPLISLAGLGLTCADRIVEERKLKPFCSIEDLAQRTGANCNVIDMLTQHGCLHILPKTNQTQLFSA